MLGEVITDVTFEIIVPDESTKEESPDSDGKILLEDQIPGKITLKIKKEENE